MIRPTYFGYNPETAGSNAFQKGTDMDPEEVRTQAIAEWEGLVASLETHGVEVIQFDDTLEPHTPDACFPNNWISCHADGTIVLYPMMAPNRRLEYRQDIVDHLRSMEPYKSGRILDLRHHAEEGRFLEGTGSLVLDRKARTAYAALSARTHLSVAEEWAREMNYELVAFDAQDASGAEIYHTNVMMSVGEGFALVCLESVRDSSEREQLELALRVGGLESQSFELAQLSSFLGNCLSLGSRKEGALLAMSEGALSTLGSDQGGFLKRQATLVASPFETLQGAGGGGVRCCLMDVD